MKNAVLFALIAAVAAAPVVASAEEHKVETKTETTEHAAPAAKTEVKKETTEHKADGKKVETKTETKHEAKEAK